MNIQQLLVVTASFGLLAACNGGGSDPGPVSATTAEGIWSGTTSTSRSLTGIVLGNGMYWVLYSAPNNSAAIAGVVVGRGTSLNGSYSATEGKDFNFEGQGAHDATVSASYVAKQSFNGSITYPGLNQTVAFTSSFNTAFDQPLSLSAIAGTYSGNAIVVGGAQEATSLVVTADGAVSGSASTGCLFSGHATPFASGGIYDLSITFGGGACSNGTSTVTGIVYYDTAARKIYSVALNYTLSNGFVFVGSKL